MMNADAILQPHPERSIHGIVRNIIYGIVMTMMVFVLHSLFGVVHWWNPFGYLVIGMTMVFVQWGTEHLWQSTIASVLKRSYSLFAYFCRVPFWFMGGGIGYTLGMLFAKKMGFIGFYDVPVKPLFVFGGELGVVSQILLHIIPYRFAMKNTQERSIPTI